MARDWPVPSVVSRYIAHAADLHIKLCTRYINSTEWKMAHRRLLPEQVFRRAS